METKQFKTTIKCAGCIAQVTPHLNDAIGENNWTVDINNPAKVLSVKSEASAASIIEAVKKAGYKAEAI